MLALSMRWYSPMLEICPYTILHAILTITIWTSTGSAILQIKKLVLEKIV